MPKSITTRPGNDPSVLPSWIRPRLSKLADAPSRGQDWLQEIKYDGYRMHARLDRAEGPADDEDRPRLDAQIPDDCRGRVRSAGKTGLPRRGALRRSPRREDFFQPDPGRPRMRATPTPWSSFCSTSSGAISDQFLPTRGGAVRRLSRPDYEWCPMALLHIGDLFKHSLQIVDCPLFVFIQVCIGREMAQ